MRRGALEAAPPEATAPAVVERESKQPDEEPAAPRPERPAAPKPDQKVVSMPRPGRPGLCPRGRPTRQSPVQRLPSRAGPAAPAAPGVRRLAREIGVDVTNPGHGSWCRIEEDANTRAHRRGAGTTRGAGTAWRSVPTSRNGAVERQPMSNIRRTTAQRLSHAWSTIPHVTQFDKADITEMEELRRKYREQVRQAGGDLTVTAMLVKVLSVAVKQFPQFNASIDAEADEIVLQEICKCRRRRGHRSRAACAGIGNADQKNLTQIAIELHQLAQEGPRSQAHARRDVGWRDHDFNLGGIGDVLHADHQLA